MRHLTGQILWFLSRRAERAGRGRRSGKLKSLAEKFFRRGKVGNP